MPFTKYLHCFWYARDETKVTTNQSGLVFTSKL